MPPVVGGVDQAGALVGGELFPSGTRVGEHHAIIGIRSLCFIRLGADKLTELPFQQF